VIHECLTSTTECTSNTLVQTLSTLNDCVSELLKRFEMRMVAVRDVNMMAMWNVQMRDVQVVIVWYMQVWHM